MSSTLGIVAIMSLCKVYYDQGFFTEK